MRNARVERSNSRAPSRASSAAIARLTLDREMPRQALLRLGPEIGLLWLRVSTSVLLFLTNGGPKIVGYEQELLHIHDPWGLGHAPTLWLAMLAMLAKVACPAAIALRWLTRPACLPILVSLVVSMVRGHPDWSLGQSQFAWLYFIVFSALMLTGPGRWSLQQT